MFDGFAEFDIETSGATIHGRRGGSGPPVLLLHSIPELATWSQRPDSFPSEVRAAYLAQFRDPAVVHAICEGYRAAATIDYRLDEAERGHRRIACPVLVLWARPGAVDSWYDPLAVWREWADDVRGGAVPGGHFLAEEAPEETLRQLLAFLT
jgi:haloacetate dehalogenase